MNIDPDDYDFDMEEQFDRMRKATALLREIASIQAHMRWQFGEPEALKELEEEMKSAQDGWMASNC